MRGSGEFREQAGRDRKRKRAKTVRWGDRNLTPVAGPAFRPSFLCARARLLQGRAQVHFPCVGLPRSGGEFLPSVIQTQDGFPKLSGSDRLLTCHCTPELWSTCSEPAQNLPERVPCHPMAHLI